MYWTPTTAGTYNIFYSFPGDATYSGGSSYAKTVTVTAPPKIDTIMGGEYNKAQLIVNEPSYYKAILVESAAQAPYPPVIGATIKFYLDGVYKTSATTKSPYGEAFYYFTPTSVGTITVKTVFEGDAKYNPSSWQRSIEVTTAPTNMIATGISVSPSEVFLDEYIDIYVDCRNDGGSGSQILSVRVNGVGVVSEWVTLNSGQTKTLTYNRKIYGIEPGTYSICAGFT